MVFSPALNIYLAESKVITMDGSVSEVSEVWTEVDQFIFFVLAAAVRVVGAGTCNDRVER